MQPITSILNGVSHNILAGVITGASGTENSARHRWYFLKEAFSPELVEHAIQSANCHENDLILDPFCGNGTTPLTASTLGYRSVGYEINPFLAFVSKTKMAQCSKQRLKAAFHDVYQKSKQGATSLLEGFSTFTKRKGIDKWLFNTEVLRGFEGGWDATINRRGAIRNTLRLGLIGAVMDVCNAYKDGKCLRYLDGWQNRKFNREDFLNAFEKRMQDIFVDIGDVPIVLNDTEIVRHDSRLRYKNDKRFKLAITSPPYLNSFDYTDIYRPELFLGRFVKNMQQLHRLRMTTLRSHVQVKWQDPEESDFGENYQTSISELRKREQLLWSNRIPIMVQAYFEDMKKVLSNLRRIAAPDASVWLVVSTSAYAGVEIPVDLIIAEIGSRAGWSLRDLHVIRNLRRLSGQQWDALSKSKNNKPHLRESLVIFDANPA